MPTTDRELAEDAHWKVIQKNTFTRWTNEHLKQVSKFISDLEYDLSDGLRLIALVEVLSGKRFGRYNKRPTHRSHKLENVSLCLELLQEEEQIKLVNIDSSDIVDCNLKLILGLIWTLILHYSISMLTWDGDDNREDQTPKQKLLAWIQSKIPDKNIRNFTTDWNDGTAIGALVDAIAPGLAPDYPIWNPRNNVGNATEAMNAAEQWLEVPQLIKPVEMCNPMVDELSMMTYLSQFPAAKLKPGAPLRPRTNPSKVRAYGPGIEPVGNAVGNPARFTVETFSAGRGEVEVQVLNSQGIQEQCQVVFNKDKLASYMCSYTPSMPGQYQVAVSFAGMEIPKSPFTVRVDAGSGDSSKVTARGPGIEKSGVAVNRKTNFEVNTKNAGNGVVEVSILDPTGHKDTVRPAVNKKSEEAWNVDYVPTLEGLHKVSVLFAGKQIPGSPFSVVTSPAIDSRNCFVTGRGIQPKGVRVGDNAKFVVHTENTGGEAEMNARVIGPSGSEERLAVQKVDTHTYECCYVPKRPGQYVASVVYAAQQVARSPFKVEVGPKKDTRIRAFGPGLTHGIVGYPASFTVETNGETGALGFAIEGPSQAKIDCKDNGDGSADISYWPTSSGEYAVHILCNEEDVPGSPYMAEISPTSNRFDPTKVEASGPGLLKTGVAVNKWAEFVVDTNRTGSAHLNVSAMEEDYTPVDVVVKDNKDGTYFCRYMPKRGGKHTIQIVYGSVAIPNSPYRVFVQEASNPDRVKVFGPAIDRPVKTNQTSYLIVDCSEAGPGDVAIALTNERGVDVPVETLDNNDNTFRIEFEPKTVGTYNACVFFGEEEIPNSPYKIQVEPGIDVGKITIQGLTDRTFVDSVNDFTVDARAVAPRGQGKVKATLTSVSHATEVPITNNNDGTYTGVYGPTEQGPHKLDVSFEGIAIPRSPFTVNVLPGFDAGRVKAFGPGLNGGSTNQPQKFTVETKGAGRGGLSLSVEGPSEAKVNCADNRNGSCSVEYVPTKSGVYDVVIRFAEKHIPGSPFKVDIVDEVNPQKVKCYGPGVETKGIRKGQPGNFTIDASQAGPATPEVSASDSRGRKRPGQVKARGDGTFDATYNLDVEGPCKVDVTYAGRPVPGSPFNSRILPPYDANRVRVTGEGVSPAGVTASIPTNFLIDTRDAGIADHDVVILDPSDDFVRPTILDKGDRTFGVTYTPCDVGRFTIKIKYGGDPVPMSPFYVSAKATGDASRVRILGGVNSSVPVGEKQVVNLDTSQAGTGNVTCNIQSPNDSDVDIDVVKNRDGTVDVAYTPRLPGVHFINLKFGGHPVPNGQFSQQAVEPKVFATKEKKEESPSGVGKHDPVDFRIPVGPIFSFVSGEVTAPSGNKHSPKLDDNHDGTVKIVYRPTELGLHRLDVWYNKLPVQGNPFHFYVHSLLSRQVVAFGPGLSHGIVREPCNFTILTKDVGAGGLSLAVEGPSKAVIDCADNKDGTCSVTYVPTTPGEYSIIIKFDDRHIVGSQYTAKIMSLAGDDQKTAQVSLGSNSEISLKVTDTDISNLTASIRHPSGIEEPCSLKRLANGTIGISFMPREVGDYLVNVYRNGKHIPNSPFRISVSETQIGNAQLVRAYGKGLTNGSSNEISEFYVDTKNAGYGGLSLSIEGPSKADIDCEDREDNTCRVTYRPTEPGSYIINIRFAEEHIPGSPYLVKIGGEPTGKVTERIVRQKDAADIALVGSDCELSVKIPGASRYDLEASVTSPSGSSESCNVQDRGDNNYSIKFVPREKGPHLVSIKHRGIHVPGSPFQFTVGPIKEGGAHKVRALGPGLENGEVHVPCTFNVYTREAGAGGLSLAVEGPSKAEIDFQDRKDGSCEISYVCSEPGNYLVTLKFDDNHIPGSPFKVFVVPAASDANKINVHDLQSQKLDANKPAAFAVPLNGAKGKLDARVMAPSGTEDEAIIQELDKNRCAVRFIPREKGLHLLHVRCNGNHIQGSPFHIQVGQEVANANLVVASGEGLSKGDTGQLCKFVVNTSRAGPGALAITIDGPSKVQLSCFETPDGFEFMYTPTQPGEYLVNVRYAGNTHVPGSPFKVHIEGSDRPVGWSDQSDVTVESVSKTTTIQKYSASRRLHDSDASKITASGAGLQRATVNKEATFTVDTARAGYNVLMVGVLGPNSQCEDVHYKHIGNKQYSVRYIVHERGDYALFVKWGDQHVPGSPFQISVQ